MQLRSALNNNSAVVTIVAVVVLVVSLGAILLDRMRAVATPPVVPVYFYDIGSGELFTASSVNIPPIDAPSGQMGVRAYVFACGECIADQTFIGWLEMYSPAAKRQLETAPPVVGQAAAPANYDVIEQGQMVRTLDNPNWVPANSERGFMLQESVQGRCGGDMPTPCIPPR